MRQLRLVAALTGAFLAVGTSVAYGHPQPRGYGESALRRDLAAIRATGVTGVLAEVREGRHRMVAAAGLADGTTRRPVEPGGYFRMGSTTKTFVAVVLLQLVAEGRLSLDDSFERWLPGVVSGNGNDGRAITVRQLLQHTSGTSGYIRGLGDLIGSPEAYRRHRFEGVTPEWLVAIAMAHPPQFAPGTGWGYSNTDYILAGMINRRVTGRH